METVLFGLGGNLGDRADTLGRAVRALAALLRVEAVSGLYESAPMYVEDQPPFLNLALAARTDRTPEGLLELAKGLESSLGRRPGRRFGPRAVDIDILFHGERVLVTPELELPHPRLAERAFVLRPLAEIAPGFRDPRSGRTVTELLAALPGDGGVVRLATPRPADWLPAVPAG